MKGACPLVELLERPVREALWARDFDIAVVSRLFQVWTCLANHLSQIGWTGVPFLDSFRIRVEMKHSAVEKNRLPAVLGVKKDNFLFGSGKIENWFLFFFQPLFVFWQICPEPHVTWFDEHHGTL